MDEVESDDLHSGRDNSAFGPSGSRSQAYMRQGAITFSNLRTLFATGRQLLLNSPLSGRCGNSMSGGRAVDLDTDRPGDFGPDNVGGASSGFVDRVPAAIRGFQVN